MDRNSKSISKNFSEETENETTLLDNKIHLIMYALNIAKNIIGSFILLLPWTFDLSGVLLSNFQLVLVFFMSAYSFCLIAFLGNKTRATTYSDMFSVFGKGFVMFVDLSIVALSICGNSGYIIFIKKRINSSILEYTGYDFPQKAIAAIITFGVIFPLSLFKKLHTIRILSTAAFISIFFVIFAVISLKISSGTNIPPVNLFPENIYNFILAFPIFAANFDCHTNAMTFYQEYKANTSKKSFQRFCFTVLGAFLLVLIVTSIFSTVCYLTIGKGISDDALNDYKPSVLITFMSFAIVFSLIVTYVLFFNAIRVSVHHTLCSILRKDIELDWKVNTAETFVLVSITGFLGIFIDSLGLYSACFWAVLGSLVVYIFPTVLALKINKEASMKWKVINMVVLIFGVVVSFIGGLATSIKEML